MAKIKFLCPHCGQSLQCDVGQQGKQVRCPPCGQLFLVPQMHPHATVVHAEKILQQAPPISETQVPTDVGSGKANETTFQKQLSPWKSALKPAEAAFGIGVVAGIASASSVQMDVPLWFKLLFDGFMAVVAGLLLAVPTYLVVGLQSTAKGKR